MSVVSVFVLFSISQGSFNSECFLWVFFSDTLCPALLVVLFWLAFPSVSLFIVCFSDVVHISHSLWQGDITHNCKQVVNRLKIPQGLSTLLFHRWSELPVLQRCHLSVFSKCCFLELLARPSSIGTLLLRGFIVHLSIL